MDIRTSFIDLIGNTPLVRLQAVSDATGCEIYGKAEFLNPGGSIKDRTALGIIRHGRKSGELQPGGVIVEGSAGNTGLSLALMGSGLGHRTVVVMPDTQSQEKMELLKIAGAEVRLVPAAPYTEPGNYVHQSEKLARELNQAEPNGAFWANQFDNIANRQIHYETTGREIWRQTDGKIDGFVCAVSTGGTLAGVGMALKERNPDVIIGLADPRGASLYHYYMQGRLWGEGQSMTDGIGQSRITRNIEGAPIDEAFQISDTEALPYIFDLIKNEGISVGPSSAINIDGAVRMARLLGPGHTIVTILCDSGERYRSKLYNKAFLQSRDLPVPSWLE